jgi:hypothetical protein
MSVYVAAPYTRPFFGSFIDSLLHSYKPETFLWNRMPGMAVDLGRNALAHDFMTNPTKAKFILFTDSDATWHPKAILRLMDHNLPMVCGGMYTRDLPPSPTWGKYVGETKGGKHIYRYGESARRVVQKFRALGMREAKDLPGNAVCLEQTKQDLWEIDGCGMHFTMIRRDVLEALRQPYFIDRGTTGAGEDFYFCRNVRKAGFPIYIDESIHTGHSVGEQKSFGIRELLEYSKHVEDLELDLADEGGTYEMQ